MVKLVVYKHANQPQLDLLMNRGRDDSGKGEEDLLAMSRAACDALALVQHADREAVLQPPNRQHTTRRAKHKRISGAMKSCLRIPLKRTAVIKRKMTYFLLGPT